MDEETISAAKEAFYNFIASCVSDSNLFNSLVSALYQHTMINSDTSKLVAAVADSIADSSIQIVLESKKAGAFQKRLPVSLYFKPVQRPARGALLHQKVRQGKVEKLLKHMHINFEKKGLPFFFLRAIIEFNVVLAFCPMYHLPPRRQYESDNIIILLI